MAACEHDMANKGCDEVTLGAGTWQLCEHGELTNHPGIAPRKACICSCGVRRLDEERERGATGHIFGGVGRDTLVAP
jgi:hypothetical protein